MTNIQQMKSVSPSVVIGREIILARHPSPLARDWSKSEDIAQHYWKECLGVGSVGLFQRLSPNIVIASNILKQPVPRSITAVLTEARAQKERKIGKEKPVFHNFP